MRVVPTYEGEMMAIPTTSMNLAAVISSLELDEPIVSVNMKVYILKSLAERINNTTWTMVKIHCDLGLQDDVAAQGEWIPELFIEQGATVSTEEIIALLVEERDKLQEKADYWQAEYDQLVEDGHEPDDDDLPNKSWAYHDYHWSGGVEALDAVLERITT